MEEEEDEEEEEEEEAEWQRGEKRPWGLCVVLTTFCIWAGRGGAMRDRFNNGETMVEGLAEGLSWTWKLDETNGDANETGGGGGGGGGGRKQRCCCCA